MNRLAQSTSPYLRQHAANPVDWYPWSDEALERAKQENKPIFLSVGYSACHWCHVMAHESFEDHETARLMNDFFINIKVDREERPDIDAIYQKVTQLMGQGGGWPLTVFLTPHQEPFFGGTYFPKEPHYGRPAFRQVLVAMHEFFSLHPQETSEQAKRFMQGFAELNQVVSSRQINATSSSTHSLDCEQGLWITGKKLLEYFDPEWGGLGREPKFPNVTSLEIMLFLAKLNHDNPTITETQQKILHAASQGLLKTLEKMWQGGIYDHLRGGFARYSVDRQWLVPHFEKMLYDNAQLLGLYAQASLIWPQAQFLQTVVKETVQYLEADMQTSEGTFYSATDADSEGEEGKYFCWTRHEIEKILAQESNQHISQQSIDHFLTVYGVTEIGNFHNKSILYLPRPLARVAAGLNLSEQALKDELAPIKQVLLLHRYQRIPPLRDEKILTCWNALTISGLVHAASAAEAWGEVELYRHWLAMAQHTATMLVKNHVRDQGEIYRAAFAGHVHTQGYLDDLASLARACLDLHEHTLEPIWVLHAQKLAQQAVNAYMRDQKDGFYMSSATSTPLIERIECSMDSALPSGLGMILEVLLRLDAQEKAPGETATIVASTFQRFAHAVDQPLAFASLILAVQLSPQRGAIHVRLQGTEHEGCREFAHFLRTLRGSNPKVIHFNFEQQPTKPRAIVCSGQTCSAPLQSYNELRQYLNHLISLPGNE